MQGKTQRALVIDDYGKKPQLREDWPIPALEEGQLLIKVLASTINPSDRIFLQGAYFKRPLPALCGIQGAGVVVEAKGEVVQHWVGKRVCFLSDKGSWCQFAISHPMKTFQIEEDVPLSSACSGIVNPLTVIGFIQNFKKLGCKGIIHTAAASALGKMLVRLCLKNNIPLLNLVRKQEQAESLRKLGATHVLITKEAWQKQFKEIVSEVGFDCVYDALGGGPITETIVNNIGGQGIYHLYGVLQNKPFQLTNPGILFSGLRITGFMLMNWWLKCGKETQEKIRQQYSKLLKDELKTNTYKEITLKEIEQGLEISVKMSNEGKIMIKIE